MKSGRRRRATAQSGVWKGLNPGMAVAAKGVVLVFVLATVWDVEAAGAVFGRVRGWIEGTLDWFYVLTVCATLFTCLFLACSRFGGIRLGDEDASPEFSRFSWLAMLFSAGIGIGVLFFSIAEPIFYLDNSGAAGYPNNPIADLAGADALDERRAVHAMRITYFHWGVHGWSAYVLVGLCLAYFGFRKKLPLTLRSALYPLIGDRIYGPVGDLVDLLAVFGGVFGIATSLGLGASQMAAGLDVLTGVDPGLVTQVSLIAVISVAATLSVVSGVRRGIRRLSEWNIGLSVLLLGSFLFLGPFTWLVGFVATSAREYVWRAIPMGFWIADGPGPAAWQNAWTIFYWGWWISWAPFVGTFIARISRGRTLREFIVGVLVVPTGLALVWFGVFGGNAIHLELTAPGGAGTAGIMELVRGGNYEAALYATIDRMSDTGWLAWAMSAMATVLVATWFVTSSDSGTLVITTFLSMGDPHPPRRFRIVWGLGVGAVAAVLLLADGLQALQTAAIAAALPVSVVLWFMIAGLLRSLARDP
ncbi:BCCT family transporter [Candidatus Palauibacter irciniicola]|uniref:BCCT family transporter n=1 Tax=Candidatus Palauibacter irciniicola TaxID=3056733 RepID=UPI003B020A01